jgi:adenosine kinase
MKTVVTGSIAFDYLMLFPGRFTEHLIADQLHNVSLSFLVDSLKRQRGGIAPNIAYTLALLGDRPMIMATAGQDFSEYRAWLEEKGVDTSAIIEIENEYCASFFATTDQEQNQIASFYTGAMAHAAKLTFAEHAADAGLVIISPNDPAAMRAYAAECKALKIPYIYDPSQQTIRLSAEELCQGIEGAALVAVNQYEYHMIEEKTGVDEDGILQRAGGLLMTRGKEGSSIFVNGERYDIPVIPPQAIVEPTGVGDAFRAGVMRGMQLGLPWPVIGRMGALAATYVLEHFGTQNHAFSRAEFVTRYRQHFDDEGALDVLLDA